jgi:hypothetical protein
MPRSDRSWRRQCRRHGRTGAERPPEEPLLVLKHRILKRTARFSAVSTVRYVSRWCMVNVHAKSCLTLEPLRTLQSETKGQAEACPDRTRAIPCKVRAVTEYTRARDMRDHLAWRASSDHQQRR